MKKGTYYLTSSESNYFKNGDILAISSFPDGLKKAAITRMTFEDEDLVKTEVEYHPAKDANDYEPVINNTLHCLEIETTDYRVYQNHVWIEFDASGVTMNLEFSHLSTIAILSSLGIINIGSTFSIDGSIGACRLERIGEIETFEGVEEKTVIVHSLDFMKDIIDTELCNTLAKECLLDGYYVDYVTVKN